MIFWTVLCTVVPLLCWGYHHHWAGLGPSQLVRREVTSLVPRDLEEGEEEVCLFCLLGAQNLQALIMWGTGQIHDPCGHRE